MELGDTTPLVSPFPYDTAMAKAEWDIAPPLPPPVHVYPDAGDTIMVHDGASGAEWEMERHIPVQLIPGRQVQAEEARRHSVSVCYGGRE